ncbi:Cof-type HAD-IIB family hydrolase [Bacillaceae bacterium]
MRKGWKEAIRLLAFDLDGTLLNEENRISDRNRQALLAMKKRGLKLLVTTGRTLPSAQEVCAGIPFDGYVCSNGMISYDEKYGLLHKEWIPGEVVLRLLSEVRKKRMFYEIHDEFGNRLVMGEDMDFLRESIEGLKPEGMVEGEWESRHRIFTRLRPQAERELSQRIAREELAILKLFVWHKDKAVLRALQKEWTLAKIPVSLTSSSPHNIEVNKRGINKWVGLQTQLRRFRLTGEQVLVFGDGLNDVEILRNAGWSVAMGNAEAAAKAAAKAFTLSNREDGVAHYLQTQFGV